MIPDLQRTAYKVRNLEPETLPYGQYILDEAEATGRCGAIYNPHFAQPRIKALTD